MTVLVIGQGRWGHAQDLAKAKANFRKEGGRLSDGYAVVDFGEALEFHHVDGIGQVHWTGEGRPEITEVEPK